VHDTIEEEVFDPALKEHPKTKEIALEAYEEHHVVDTVMAEIERRREVGRQFKVMKENLEHHIEEEEVRCSRRPSRSASRPNSLRSANQ